MTPATGRRAAAARVLAERPWITLIVVLVLLALAAEGITPGFLSLRQADSTLAYAAPLAFLAAGETIVMITGGIDLSAANTATAAGYLLAVEGHHGWLWSVAVALLTGLTVGAVNGVGIGVFKVQPLIMTLGVGSVITGLLTIVNQASIGGVVTVPAAIATLASAKLGGFLPVSLLLWAPVAAVIILGLRHTGLGRLLYGIGDNPTASRLAGVRHWQVTLGAYVLCSVLCAVGGMLLAGLTNAPDLGLADSYLLPAIAATVIGGTSVFGGFGGYAGTVISALILTVLTSMLTLINATDAVRQMLYGFVILALAAAYIRLTQRG